MTTQRRIIAYNPPPDRPVRKPVCGVDCHQGGRWGGLTVRTLGVAALLAVVVFCVAVTHHTPTEPAWNGGSTSSHIYPHDPAWGAAAVAGEARGAARVAGGAARWGFRGARLSRGGSFHVPGTGGFHGYGFGLFGGF